MTFYREDYKYSEAMKVVESLDENNERDALIKYYIEKNKRWYDEQSALIKEYQEVFDRINRFLPGGRGPVVMGDSNFSI